MQAWKWTPPKPAPFILPVSAPPYPENYGGFSGRPLPDFADGIILDVTYWTGTDLATDQVVVQHIEGDSYQIGPALDWRCIQTWAIATPDTTAPAP